MTPKRIAIKLAAYGWNEERVGIALTVDAISTAVGIAGRSVKRLRARSCTVTVLMPAFCFSPAWPLRPLASSASSCLRHETRAFSK